MPARFVAFASLVCVGFLAATPVCAAGLFDETSKDFGSVPHGTVLTHQFQLTNHQAQQVHIASLRTSCGCATATLGRDELNPGQSTVLQVVIDTRKYSGYRQFTIHVLCDRPVLEEVRLTVTATSRDDITLTPGQLEFGRVKRGSAAKATTTIQYHGTGNWQVTGVENENAYLKPELQQLGGEGSLPTYQLTVALRPDIPAGAWHADLWLKTTDPATPRIRVPLVVEVESALTATPSEVQLGQVKGGTLAERKVVIRGPSPFKITKIDGQDEQFKISGAAEEAKAVHVLKVTFTATGDAGEVRRKLRIHTDLADGETVELGAAAMIVP
jgi:uncharacterized protein DUF1573